MEQLIEFLRTIAPLSAALEAHLRLIIALVEYRKGDIILTAGDICDQIFFIESGLVRSHYYNEDNEEVTNWLMREGDICIAVLSFLRRASSFETHTALEPCRCWSISHEQLYETYRLYPEFIYHGLVITGEYYCRGEERTVYFKMQPKLARYKLFMEHFPELANRVSNKHLATFLGLRGRSLDDAKKAYLNDLKRDRSRKKN
ncbi:MAG TPA: cyclic nucleotide-binding domain-containing protein [Puia sp.]|nr:cyclic nucleotide-binding domain-containing protein [Puia sp.]